MDLINTHRKRAIAGYWFDDRFFSLRSVVLILFLIFCFASLLLKTNGLEAQTIVVEWNFPNNPDDNIADGGVPANSGKLLTAHGGVNPPAYSQSGSTTRCASANHWANGANTHYWQIEFSTLGYGDMTLESKQSSFSPENYGPKDFLIQYRIGLTGTWTTFAEFEILTGNQWFQFPAVNLPSVCEDQSSVYVRWLMASNIPTQGSGLVNDEATNRIDDILVKSYCPLPDPPPPITGDPVVCAGENGVIYAIPPIGNATGYYWEYSGSGISISGNNTATISIDFSFSATSGNLSVYGINACGIGPVSPDLWIDVIPIPLVVATPVSQTICPFSAINPIILSNPNAVPGCTYSWTRDNAFVLTGIPASGTSNPITGVLNSSNPQQTEITVFTITATANGCSSSTTASVIVYDDTPPWFVSFPPPVHWCVQDITIAFWDGFGDITPIRPDWFTFNSGDPLFDLEISTFSDNCTSSVDLLLHWRIDLAGGTVIAGTGQISSYPDDILFPLGNNTITYWLEDQSGNFTPTGNRPVVIVTVHARPDITRNF